MPVSVGTAYVDIKPDLSGFGRDLDAGVGKASSDAGEKAGGALSGGFKKAATAIGGYFAATEVAGFLKDSIGAASDLGESMSKVNVVFGDGAGRIQEFAKTAASSLGMSRQAALEATGTLGNLFSSMGLGKKETADLSTSMVSLASDLASFNNASPDETLLALRSGLLGEAEPLKRFGVNLNQARIEAEAFAIGLAKPAKNADLIAAARLKVEEATKSLTEAEKAHGAQSAEAVKARADLAKAEDGLAKSMEGSKVELTAAQKAQAAYSLIMKDTKLAQGDFARTSDGLANKQRILAAQFTDLKARIGGALMPAALGLASFLSDNLLPAFDKIGAVIGKVRDAFSFLFQDQESQGFAEVMDNILGNSGQFIDFFRTVGDAILSVANIFRGGSDSMGQAGAKLTGIFEQIKTLGASYFGALQAVFETFANVVSAIWDRFGGTIIEYFKGTWEFITEALRGVLETLSGIFDLIKAVLTGKWGEAWEALKKIFDGVWDTLFAYLRQIFTNVLPTVIGLAQAGISAAWSLLWNSLKTLFTDLWDGIWSAVTTAIGSIVGFIKELPGKMAEAGKGMWDFFFDTFKEAYNAVARFIRGLDFTLDVPDILPGPDEYTIGFPDLPLLGDGGVATRSGAAIVGERGAELLELPRGARVTPLERDLEPAAASAAPLIGEFNLNGSDLSAWDVADEIGWLMRTTGR